MSKKDNHWFKHEYDADDGDNLVGLRLKGGNAAIGLYWRTYPKIHKASNRYPFANDTARDVLAAKLSIAREVLDEFITQAIECNLFKIEGGFLCSDKVEKQLAEQQAKSKSAAESGRLGGLAKASKTLANGKRIVASRVEKRREEKIISNGNNSYKKKVSEAALIGEAPSPEADKLPEPLQELFKSQGKEQQLKNVWVTEAECEKLRGRWGDVSLEKGMNALSAWSVNPDINPKTKLPGWKSYRMKRDHARTLDNLLKRMEQKGEL